MPVAISRSERDALNDLAELIGEPIPAVTFVDSFKFGFVVKEGHVARIGIASKKLQQLPENFGNLSWLEEVAIFNNLLETIPESFGNLVSLKYLNLVSNRLRMLPNALGRLTNLEILYLNNLPAPHPFFYIAVYLQDKFYYLHLKSKVI